jgi:hypothetical protein
MLQFETSSEKYLTGNTALNIPTEDGDFADWHGTSIFSSGNSKYIIAGENSRDTNNIFGSYGVRECSSIIKQYFGLVFSDKVYAANYIRALLDIVFNTSFDGRKPTKKVRDILSKSFEQSEFWKRFNILKKQINNKIQLQILTEWENENRA